MRRTAVIANVYRLAKNDLLRRIVDHHVSLGIVEKQHDAESHARSILRWMKSSEKCQDEHTLQSMVDDYVTREKPLAYILGNQPFGKLDLLVEAPILIPRPETEQWTYRLIETLENSGDLTKPGKVLDICSGTGCIGLAVAQAAPRFQVTGLDISEAAVKLAQRNASRHQLDNIKFHQVDIFDDSALSDLEMGKFDIILSNPPYIPPVEFNELDKSVKDHEDPRALVGKRHPADWLISEHKIESLQGLDFYYRLKELHKRFLIDTKSRALGSNIPTMVMEHGLGQSGSLQSIFGGSKVEVGHDFNGIERTLSVYG